MGEIIGIVVANLIGDGDQFLARIGQEQFGLLHSYLGQIFGEGGVVPLKDCRNIGDGVTELVGDIVEREGALLVIAFNVMADVGIGIVHP